MSNNNNEQTKYKGVRKRKWGKWVSEIRLPNSRDRIWLGSFDTPYKAARAFDAAQFCLRGPYANFNFPESLPDVAVAATGSALMPHQIQAFATAFANQDTAAATDQILLQHATDNNNNDNESPPHLLNSMTTAHHHHDSSPILPSPLDHSNNADAMDCSFFNIHNNNNNNNDDDALFSGELYKMHSGEFCIPEPDILASDEDHLTHYAQCSSSFLWNF